jgi:hypothetical protein
MVLAAPAVLPPTQPHRPPPDASRATPGDRSLRATFTGAFALAVAAAGYAWVRAAEAVLFPRADPRAIVAVTEGGYLARCAVAAVIGGMGAFGGWALASRPERGARALVAVVGVAVVAVALQVGLAP